LLNCLSFLNGVARNNNNDLQRPSVAAMLEHEVAIGKLVGEFSGPILSATK
jgi:hypothetical protein